MTSWIFNISSKNTGRCIFAFFLFCCVFSPNLFCFRLLGRSDALGLTAARLVAKTVAGVGTG